MLWMTARRFGSLNDDCFQSLFQEFGIVDIGRRNHHRQRPARSIGQNAAFRPIFRSIGGVGPNRAPPNRALPMAVSAACQSRWTALESSHSLMMSAQVFSNKPT